MIDLRQAVEHYRELLTYVKSAVTRNYSEKSINNMLDFIEKGSDNDKAYHCMEKFYSLTLESFQSTNNERLWLKTNIKLARLWLDRKQYTELVKKVRDLHKACQREDGTDDPSKGTYALEVYALEIQMYADTRNNKRLKVSPVHFSRGFAHLEMFRLYTIAHCKFDRPYHIPRSWVSYANAAVRCI